MFSQNLGKPIDTIKPKELIQVIKSIEDLGYTEVVKPGNG